MSDKDTGGPAFPAYGDGSETWINDGMTLRDYFAAKAMQGLISNPGFDGSETKAVGVTAYAVADLMLKERNK